MTIWEEVSSQIPKKSFNKQVEEFEMDIPYTKYYITLVSDEPLLPEQELIVSDYEVE